MATTSPAVSTAGPPSVASAGNASVCATAFASSPVDPTAYSTTADCASSVRPAAITASIAWWLVAAATVSPTWPTHASTTLAGTSTPGSPEGPTVAAAECCIWTRSQCGSCGLDYDHCLLRHQSAAR